MSSAVRCSAIFGLPGVPVQSGGFENGAAPAWPSFGGVEASLTSLQARTGSSSLAETGGLGGVYQEFRGLTPGAVYQVTAYARSAPGSAAQALLWVHDTVNGGSVFDGWRTPSTSDWDAYTVTFVATTNGRMRVHLISNGVSGTIYWDDVSGLDGSGFEDGVQAPWHAFGGVATSITGSQARTGSSSAAETGGWGGLYQDLSGLTPGAVYQVTAYAHSDPGTTAQGLLWVHDTVGGGSLVDGWRTPSTSGWEAFTVTFVATATGRLRIHLVSSGGSGTIYWDDVRIADGSGFETGPASWFSFGDASASITNSPARTGSSSLAETGGSGGAFQDFSGLTPGGAYQITVYAVSAPGTTAQGLLWIHDTIGGGSVFDGWRTPSTGGWEAYTVTFVATANGRMRIHLISSGGSGAIYWDDLRIN